MFSSIIPVPGPIMLLVKGSVKYTKQQFSFYAFVKTDNIPTESENL